MDHNAVRNFLKRSFFHIFESRSYYFHIRHLIFHFPVTLHKNTPETKLVLHRDVVGRHTLSSIYWSSSFKLVLSLASPYVTTRHKDDDWINVFSNSWAFHKNTIFLNLNTGKMRLHPSLLTRYLWRAQDCAVALHYRGQCNCTVLRPDCACKLCHANHVSGEGFSVLLPGAEQGDHRPRKSVRSQGHSVSFPELKESPGCQREVRVVNASCGFFQKGWMGPQERKAISGFCNSVHCNEAVGKTLELSKSLGIRKTTRAGSISQSFLSLEEVQSLHANRPRESASTCHKKGALSYGQTAECMWQEERFLPKSSTVQ